MESIHAKSLSYRFTRKVAVKGDGTLSFSCEHK